MATGDDLLRNRLQQIRQRLDNPEPILRQWGALLLKTSQRAFVDQSFDGKAWPARYPQQARPKLNLAGVIQDFATGRNAPKAIRFVDRPAVIDTKDLFRSLSFALISKDTVEAGSNIDHAGLQNFGGETVQPITPAIKERLRNWLYKKPKKGDVKAGIGPRLRAKFVLIGRFKGGPPREVRGEILHWELQQRHPKGTWRTVSRTKSKTKADNWKRRSKKLSLEKKSVPIRAASITIPGKAKGVRRTEIENYRDKIEALLKKDQLVTQVGARPFVGVPQDTARDMIKAAERFFERGGR